MAAIHRLLCTHCTFGGSQLEPSTTDNAAKVLGYSVRRSSLPEPDRGPLRTTFRAVERLLSYDLPKDTPPAKKESLNAETAPSRLIFMPNLAGWQAVAHVSYRTRDTHGRVGSYFADVLAARLDRDTRPLCQLEILKLWSASNNSSLQSDWWCDSEESLAQRDGDGRWKPSDVTALAELREDAGPVIDDRLLYQFLTLEPGNAAHDPGQIVPARWWSMPSLQRRDLLAALLNATVQSRKNGGRENAVIAAEPAVAAVLFYGVFRLLPSRLREGIGFSTYEAFPERPLTPLVATTFHDGEASTFDLPPELVGRGFSCNTFRDVAKFGRTQPIAADGFVRRAIDLALASDGWDRLDGFLTSIDALPRPDFRNLDELARIDAFLTNYLTSSHQLDDVTPEPAASPGSNGEKYRRIRFCKLIRGIGGNPIAKLPHNLVRKAIDWFGEEFPKQWDSDGEVASALRARMPDNDNELAAVLKAVTASRTVSPAFVGEAVVRVALAASLQTLPSSYVKFVSHEAAKTGMRGGTLAGSTTLVQPVLERLAAEHRQDLIEAANAALVEPILESIAAWEKQQPGRWKELRLPLLPLVEHELTARRTTTEERAEFLVRHDALATVLDQCAVPPALVEVMDGFFSHILRLKGTESISLQPGELLSADGHSRTESLGRWLCLAEPYNKRRYQERLAAWKTIHDIILALRSPAEKAGSFSKCPGDVSRFADAYDVLSRDHTLPGKEMAQKLGIFLANSMDGLKVAGEPARKTIVRWLAASLPTDFDGADISDLFLRDEVVGSTRFGLGRPQNWIKWIYAGVGASVTLAAVVIAVLLARRPDLAPQPDETSTAHKETSERSEAKQTKAETPQAPKVSKSSQVTGQAIAAVERTPSPDPAPPAPESTLTPQSINLRASLDSGAIKVSWDKDVVAGAQLTLTVFIPAEDSEKPLPPEPIAQADIVAGSIRWPIKDKNVFGDYFFQLAAQPKDSPSIESVKVEVPISQPPEPQIESVRLVVAKDGKPALSLKFKAPSTSDLTKYGTCMAVLSMQDGSEKQELPFSDSLSLPLPDKNLTPTRLLDAKSPLTLYLETDLGASSACDVQIQVPEGGLEAEVKDRLARKQSEGVTHVCALEETAQPGKLTPLLDLPWWFVGPESKDFGLDLLTSGNPAPADIEDPEAICLNRTEATPMQWVCKSGTATLGFFEVVDQNTWKPRLCFKAAASTGEDDAGGVEQAYMQLRTYKLCFLHHRVPFSTAQLMAPSLNGPLLINLPREPNDEEISLMVASCSVPRAVAKLKLHPVLVVHAAEEQVASGMSIELHPPEKAFVAQLCASQAGTQIAASVNLIPDRPKPLRIDDWKWTKAPLREKESRKAKVPAAEGEPVSPRLLTDVGERKNQLTAIEQNVKRLTQAHAEEKDEKKKSEKASELKKATTSRDKLVVEQNLKQDHLFLPCYELFDALVGNEIKISNWRLTWNVKSLTATPNVKISPNIPGGLTVVGVVGTDAGKPPVKFEPEKKK